MCHRLAKQNELVEQCRIFGVQGDRQHGIDIYARLDKSDRYFVYQCKREKNFGPAKIKAAVTKFLNGDWVKKSDRFYLCAQESFRKADRAKAIETQALRMQKEGIELIPWDADELNVSLKNHPHIVDDFFGRRWAEVFCGESAAEKLGVRLDAHEAKDYRSRLALLYETIFMKCDPGIPEVGISSYAEVPIRDRFVIPDIIERRRNLAVDRQSIEPPVPFDTTGRNESDLKKPFASMKSGIAATEHRTPADLFLGLEERIIILGPPGAGKSTLLRYIILDMLSEEPTLRGLLETKGGVLPLWVPFPLWVEKVANPTTQAYSLEDLLQTWFHSYSENCLWDLVSQALTDSRLMLFVDGIDEWTNVDAAKIAINRLTTFVETRKIPAVLVSRPRGFELLSFSTQSWKTTELAELSDAQRSNLIKTWYKKKCRVDQPTLSELKVDQIAIAETNAFLSELQNAESSQLLSRNPLLLSILINHRFRKARLPASRFEAYSSMVEHMVSIHPTRRRFAAGFVSQQGLTERELSDTLANLAFKMQSLALDGSISVQEGEDIIVAHLSDPEGPYGHSKKEARENAQGIVSTTKDVSGICVEKSPGHIGFYHRRLQEHLAALHLSKLPIEEQVEVVLNFCTDTRWYEVIVELFHRCTNLHSVEQLIAVVREVKLKSEFYQAQLLDILLCEIACSDTLCSSGTAQSILDSAFDEIETSSWAQKQKLLIPIVLRGLGTSRVRELVRSRVARWFPCRSEWRSGILESVSKWSDKQRRERILIQHLFDENFSNQHTASVLLSELASDAPLLTEELISIAKHHPAPRTQAALISALFRSSPNNDDLAAISQRALRSGCPDLRIASLLAQVARGDYSERDERKLLDMANWGRDVDFSWQDDIAVTLMKYWPRSEFTKRYCLDSLARLTPGKRVLNPAFAERVLIEGYPKDDEVRKFCLREISGGRPFISLRQSAWALLRTHWSDDEEIVGAIDRDILSKQPAIWMVESAALVGRTEIGLQFLLANIEKGSRVWWPSALLLEGWGMDEPAVGEALLSLANGDPATASTVGHLFSRLFPNSVECRQRLVSLLEASLASDSEIHRWRVGWVIEGINALGSTEGDEECAELAVAACGKFAGLPNDGVSNLMLTFSWNKSVRNLALDSLERSNTYLNAIAAAFPNDDEITSKLENEIVCLPNTLRAEVVDALLAGCAPAEATRSFLSRYELEANPEIRVQASVGYHRLLASSSDVSEEWLRHLVDECGCAGPDANERGQAAVAGLLTLNRFDMFVKGISQQSKQPCSTSFFGSTEINFRFVEMLAKNWTVVKDALGDQIWGRLSGFSDPSMNWKMLAACASENSDATRDLLQFIHDDSESAADTGVLSFLEKVGLRDGSLLNYLIGLKGTMSTGASDAGSIINSFGENFGGDEYALRLFWDGRDPCSLNDFELCVLAAAWPESPEARAVFESRKGAKRGYDPLTFAYITCTFDPTEKALVQLRRLVRAVRGDYSRLAGIERPFIRRLRTDQEFFDAVWNWVKRTDQQAVRVAVPPLLIAARGLTVDLREWCCKELEAQSKSTRSSDIAFEVTSGEHRTMISVLLDTLHSASSGA